MEKINYNFEEMKWDNLTPEQIRLWEKAFPSLDVIDILALKIPVWLSANPSKACKYKNWQRFITNWLGAAEDKYKRYVKTS